MASFYNNDNPTKAVDEAVKFTLDEQRAGKLLEEKLALVEAYGADTLPNGTIMKFDKLFDKNGTVYSYVVLKANNKWYCTGSVMGFSRGSWDELVLALVSGTYPLSSGDVIMCTMNKHTLAEVS